MPQPTNVGITHLVQKSSRSSILCEETTPEPGALRTQSISEAIRQTVSEKVHISCR